MASMIKINLRPDEGTLRQFGWIALAGFWVIAILAWNEWLIFAIGLGTWRPFVAGVFVVLGLLAAFFSLVYPRANRGLYVGMALIGAPIGFVVGYVIMAVLFYGMLAPLGGIFRFSGRDVLHRRFEPDSESYWADPRPARPRESYFRQF